MVIEQKEKISVLEFSICNKVIIKRAENILKHSIENGYSYKEYMDSVKTISRQINLFLYKSSNISSNPTFCQLSALKLGHQSQHIATALA